LKTGAPALSRIGVREGLLSTPLDDLGGVRLLGSRCSQCHETTLGTNSVCPNCGGDRVTAIPLSNRGTLWTYTVVRHKPPGDYKGPDPFVPFAMGLVELPEGLRVLTPLEGEVARFKIGMSLQFHAFVRSRAEQPEVVSFAFRPTGA
jgi:uncharacterized OB-fold protein